MSSSAAPPKIALLELAGAGALSLAILAQHVSFFRNAGALWRDEVNSVALAQTPSLFGNWLKYQYDSFPIGWFVVLRGWMGVFGSSDAALRALGLVIGMALLLAVWVAARQLGARVPTISLALFAASATTIRYGDSIRGYGLGAIFAIAVIAAFGRVVSSHDRWSPFVAATLAIVSVHFLFYNAVVVFAAAIALTIILILQRRWSVLLIVSAGSLIAAISLVIYVPVIRAAASWNYIFLKKIDLAWIGFRAQQAVDTSGWFVSLVWAALFMAAPIVLIIRRLRESEQIGSAEYCALTALVGSIAYAVFLYRLSYPMNAWYLLVAMALTAVTFDGIFGSRKDHPAIRLCVLAGAALLVAVTWGQVRDFISERETNIDLAAQLVADKAGPSDLVLVFPWPNGVSFARYWNGSAKWETIPPIVEHAVHRYDLVITAQRTPAALDRQRAEISGLLATGKRVWIVSSERLARAEHQSTRAARVDADTEAGRVAFRHVMQPLRVADVCFPWTVPGQNISSFERVGVECRQIPAVGSEAGH